MRWEWGMGYGFRGREGGVARFDFVVHIVG